jgi:molybdenum cofactor cytidylyltransferase
MQFAAFPLDEAEGAILAHTRRVGGAVLKKGIILDASAIASLRAAGIVSVFAAKLAPTDLAENASADRLAARLVVPGLRRSPASTGRVNLIAETAGLLHIDTDAINQINQINEALTIATLPNASIVSPGDMIATIKVIPFAVALAVQGAVEAAAHTGIFTLNPFQSLKVGLVLSEMGALKQSVIDGTIEVMRTRITGLGGTLLAPRICQHDTAAIAEALRQLSGEGAELLLIAAASATVDRADIGPAAIVAAGGEITHFGMPVDPGNLICMGKIGDMHAIVLPGCARSPKLNGIDFVLSRLFAGLPVGRSEITAMGVGGLLKDTEARPLPRARAHATKHVAALVLAAGASSRMGAQHKLLIADAAGRTMIAHTVDHLRDAGIASILVVTGHREAEIRAALAGRNLRFIHAPHHAEGLAESLKSGLMALPDDVAGVLVCLGDMPLVKADTLRRIIAAYDPDEGRAIIVPTHQGEFGNPVLWDRSFIPEMMQLTGDQGARKLLRRHAELVTELALESDGILRDFDTPQSLAGLDW